MNSNLIIKLSFYLLWANPSALAFQEISDVRLKKWISLGEISNFRYYQCTKWANSVNHAFLMWMYLKVWSIMIKWSSFSVKESTRSSASPRWWLWRSTNLITIPQHNRSNSQPEGTNVSTVKLNPSCACILNWKTLLNYWRASIQSGCIPVPTN